MGVQLKSKAPWMYAQTDSLGLHQQPCRRFKVNLACGSNQSHKWSRKSLLVLQSPASYEMVFKCADGTFGCIAAMDVWWHQLKINVYHCKEILEDGGHFIIQVLKVWSQASLTEACMEHLESHQEGASVAVLEQFCQNGIAVMVIEDHNVVVAGAGWGWKFPSLGQEA